MPQSKLKLRGKKQSRKSVYPLGEFPRQLVYDIAKRLVHLSYVGKADITGDDCSYCFAKALGGESHSSNLHTQDVSFENCAWSVKTVKNPAPFECDQVRLISGRNSPTYSGKINDPFKDIDKTGRVVLEIWNKRIDRTLSDYEDFRLLVVVRNFNTLQFAMFETENTRFTPSNYFWKINNRRNFEGFDAVSRKHRFTWQPHGGQFTIIRELPASTSRYEIRCPPTLDIKEVLRKVGFEQSWVTFHKFNKRDN